ncbi:hypothetical protein AVEN_209943-1 [Araneus ventricosus]|uniref:Uncharacterized protein n=1 Tax=Araneus ventricosus TaxID=182803 RepID=A0A4Y2DB75_ARAVE|nr:hypothetical protein AVEN_209943-1 [Araneus ventricosus]
MRVMERRKFPPPLSCMAHLRTLHRCFNKFMERIVLACPSAATHVSNRDRASTKDDLKLEALPMSKGDLRVEEMGALFRTKLFNPLCSER